MGINITTQDLLEILDQTPATQNIMLVGRHGIGKSEILTQYFSAKGMKVVALFLGQMSDPGDLIGLPSKAEFSTGKNGSKVIVRTEFIPPYWWPLNNEPIVLFLDELNRARPEVLQTIMDLALNRKLAGRLLPEGSRIISAVNAGEEYQLTDLDPALVSRFNIYNFRPTINEWLLWAEKEQLDYRVVSFIQNEGVWLDGNEGQKAGIDTGLDKTPDRRAWKKVSDVLLGKEDLNELHKKLVAGIVGPAATSRFFGSITGNKVLSGMEVLLNFDKYKAVLAKYKLHQFAIVNDGIFRYLEAGDIKGEAVQTITSNLLAYYTMLEKAKNQEAIAHFASVFEKNAYPKAILFILDNTPKIYDKLMKFIANL